MFKPLLKDIPVPCDLPNINFKVEVLKLGLTFTEVNKGHHLIRKEQVVPELDMGEGSHALLGNHLIHILYKGKLKFSKYSLGELELEEEEKKASDMFYNRENFKEVTPMCTFGALDGLTLDSKDCWQPKYVYALEDS